MHNRLRSLAAVGPVLILVAAPTLQSTSLSATTYTINTLDDLIADDANCTLREAFTAATINAAVDVCPAGGAIDDIELGPGRYELVLGELWIGSGETLTIRGPASDPPNAILAAGPGARVLRVSNGADLTLAHLVVTDGAPNPPGGTLAMGGGVWVEDAGFTARGVRFEGNTASLGGAVAIQNWAAAGGRQARIEQSVVVLNTAQYAGIGQPQGGGLWISIGGGNTATIVDTIVEANLATSVASADQPAGGGGMWLSLTEGGGSIDIVRTAVIGNTSEAPSTAGNQSAGIHGQLSGSVGTGSWTLHDVLIADNQVSGNPTFTLAAGLSLATGGGVDATLDRVTLLRNGSGPLTPQAYILSGAGGNVTVENALVVDGGGSGLNITTNADATLLLNHTTITAHPETGLRTGNTGTGTEIVVANTVLFGNDTDLSTFGPLVLDPSTLVGVDPLFSDAPNGDYRLTAASPARDTGTLAFPHRPFDLLHGPRVVGSTTDAGAFEFGALFADDFETGDTAAWSGP